MYATEEELQCLAAWKEGSYRYFLGLVQYRHHASSYEDRFRCFAYEVISSNGGGGGSGQNVGNIRRGELLLSSHHNSHSHQQYPQTLALGRSRPKPYHGVSMIGGTGSGSNSNNGSSPHNLMSTSEIVYRVEQSGDATCNGLSTMEGSRTMFLRKGNKCDWKNEKGKSCLLILLLCFVFHSAKSKITRREEIKYIQGCKSLKTIN